MEKLEKQKFCSLTKEEMNKIEGGRWHVQCLLCSDNSSLLTPYRTNIWGNIVEWGTPQQD